jgi:hypothetical protein
MQTTIMQTTIMQTTIMQTTIMPMCINTIIHMATTTVLAAIMKVITTLTHIQPTTIIRLRWCMCWPTHSHQCLP